MRVAPLLAGLPWVLVALAVWAAGPSEARADDAEVFARVVVDATPLRSGPGPGFRRIGVATRGETFPVRRRATSGYWFEIERPDGTFAWVLGDTVYTHEVGEVEGARKWRVFAPPPLADARMEIAAMFGALGGGGFMAVRPTLVLDAYFGVEVTGAASVNRAGNLLLVGGGGVVNVFPLWPVVPFLVVGGGAAFSDPNADTFLLEEGTTGMLYAGGGLRFGFRKRLVLRIEVRSYVFFEPDSYVSQEEYSGGITVFF